MDLVLKDRAEAPPIDMAAEMGSGKKHPPVNAQMGFLTVDYLMSL